MIYFLTVPDDHTVLVSQTGAVPGTGVSNGYWYLKLLLVPQTGTRAFGPLCLLFVF